MDITTNYGEVNANYGQVTTNYGEVTTNYAEHAVAQFVEALCYKSEGRGFDSRWCHWNFSLT